MPQIMEYIEFTESIPKKGKFDILVAGGGVAGVAASLAARRAGKSVLLLEKTNLLGGLATIGLINLFVPLCNGRGKIIIRGMAEELLRLSIRYGYDTIPSDWKNGEPEKPTDQRYLTRYSPQIFAVAMTDLLAEEGVNIRFDAQISTAVIKNGHCEGLVIQTKSGREYYEAEQFIDTTGDADVLFQGGVPTIQGKNYYTYIGHEVSLETCKKAVESGDIGKLTYYRAGGRASLYGTNHPEGMKFFTGTSLEDISEYLVLNQRHLLREIKDAPRNTRDVVTLPTMPQFRTTRRIDGDYTLKPEDTYRHFEDSVGAICDFDRRDYLFEIPYRTLIRSGFDNILTAGRSAAGEGYAWDVLRVIPPAIISGQAAGTAAAQAIDTRRPIYDLDLPRLQKSLERGNVLIHFDDSLIPAAPAKDEHADIGHI